MFLTVMVIGLAGLLVMALPAFGRHGSGHAVHHALGAKAAAMLPGHGLIKTTNALAAATKTAVGPTRFLPSPRLVFSVLALYGAFGNALVRAAHLPPLVAALVAVVPAALVERFAVTPLWNLLFRFQGQPSAPLEELVLVRGDGGDRLSQRARHRVGRARRPARAVLRAPARRRRRCRCGRRPAARRGRRRATRARSPFPCSQD